MKTKLIACNMIRDEVLAAMERVGADYPVEWIEEGLHTVINKLRVRVQEALDASEGFDRVLLAFGACGNMIDGLRTGGFELILPDVDDCVSLMLYPHRPGKETGVYYLTAGWCRSGRNAWDDRKQLTERFGEKRAARIVGELYGNYHALRLVDTGAYALSEIEEECRENAASFGWTYGVEPGSTDWIGELLAGPWDERFLRYGPRETIDAMALLLPKVGVKICDGSLSL
jgi:hypothetical protein